MIFFLFFFAENCFSILTFDETLHIVRPHFSSQLTQPEGGWRPGPILIKKISPLNYSSLVLSISIGWKYLSGQSDCWNSKRHHWPLDHYHGRLAIHQCDQIWQNFATVEKFKILCQFLDCLWSIWQNNKHPLVSFYAIGQIFIAVNGLILIKKSSHLVTLNYTLPSILYPGLARKVVNVFNRIEANLSFCFHFNCQKQSSKCLDLFILFFVCRRINHWTGLLTSTQT